jgi:hypothetical protein
MFAKGKPVRMQHAALIAPWNGGMPPRLPDAAAGWKPQHGA